MPFFGHVVRSNQHGFPKLASCPLLTVWQRKGIPRGHVRSKRASCHAAVKRRLIMPRNTAFQQCTHHEKLCWIKNKPHAEQLPKMRKPCLLLLTVRYNDAADSDPLVGNLQICPPSPPTLIPPGLKADATAILKLPSRGFRHPTPC